MTPVNLLTKCQQYRRDVIPSKFDFLLQLLQFAESTHENCTSLPAVAVGGGAGFQQAN